MSRPATATVLGSHFSSNGHRLEVLVNLDSPIDGTRVTASIEPRDQHAMQPGQRIPVRYYYLGTESSVLYAGPNGDVRQVDYGVYHTIAASLAVFASLPLLAGIIRFLRMLAASNAPIKTRLRVVEVSVGRWTRHVRAYDACCGMDLEWRVLRRQPSLPGSVAVGGHVRAGHWLVIELPSGEFIWPSSRAQPVIGTGMQAVPPSDVGASPLIVAHHRLLSAYVQIMMDVDQLPFMVRRPPSRQDKSKWWTWWFGAPRFVVRGFVVGHVRRRLRTLGNQLTRASMVTEIVYSGTSRTALGAAGDECRTLAATLPRSTWRTVAAFLLTVALPTALTIYTAFIQAPPIDLKFSVPHDVFLFIAVAITITVPFTFNRSVWCKQVMFFPDLGSPALPNTSKPSSVSWDVYKFERELFVKAGLEGPSEWEARSWVTALLLEAYVLAIFMPLLFASNAISVVETVLATLLLSVVVAVVVSNRANRISVHTLEKKRRPSIPWLRLLGVWSCLRYKGAVAARC